MEEITRYKEKLAKRYVTSKRHTMQVDHYPYLAELRQVRRKGARLAKKSGVPAPYRSLADHRPEEVSIRIDAAPEVVWDLISDVTRMGQWSPECRRCHWRGDKRGVGSRFIGINRRGWVVWITSNTIERTERGKFFAFRTTTNGVRWSYRLERDGKGGTVLTEVWDVSGQTTGQRKRTASFANTMLGGHENHTRELREGMRRTLERVKAAAEAQGRLLSAASEVSGSERPGARVMETARAEDAEAGTVETESGGKEKVGMEKVDMEKVDTAA